MTSFINLMGNDVWSEQDILNRCRAEVESKVTAARQSELRTIMLGHISQLRAATEAEMEEILLVKTLTEAAGDLSRAARTDMALLASAMSVESAMARLAKPALETDDGALLAADVQERDAAQAVVDAASVEVNELVALRNPAPVEADEGEAYE